MNILFHPVLSVLVRVALGGVLVYASFHKIADPPDFAKILYNYKVFPASWINPLSIVVPWVEAVTGIALITGLGKRGGAWIAFGLFASFAIVLSYNLARGCPTICGCFDTFANNSELTPEQKFTEMKKEILLVDVPCLLLACHAIASSCGCWARGGASKA